MSRTVCSAELSTGAQAVLLAMCVINEVIGDVMQPNICIPLRYVLYKYIKANRHDVFPAVTLVIYYSRCRPLEQLRYQLSLEMACIYLCLSGMRVILRSTYH